MRILRILPILTAAIAACLAAVGAPPLAHSSPKAQVNSTASDSLQQHYAGAQEIFRCTFDAAADAAAVAWPEHWTREHSAAYPPYLKVWIDDAAPANGGHSLRMDLDGGAAAVYSPTIPAGSNYTYVFQCSIKTDGLVHNRASLSVTFYDAQNKVLERQVSFPLGTTTPWTRLQIGPVAPTSAQTDHAVIGLSLEPGERADLKGAAWFADVWAGRLPKMTVETNRGIHLYLDSQHPEIHANVTGLNDEDAAVTFTLLDAEEHQLARENVPLQIEHDHHDAASRSGTAGWQPQLPGPGFYRVRISLAGDHSEKIPQEITLAIIHNYAPPLRGEFGWTLPDREGPLTLAELSELASRGGINWLKFPVWSAGASSARSDAIQTLVDQVDTAHVQLIGLLTDPPEAVCKQFGNGSKPSAAQIFSAKPEIWFPSLEPVIGQLSRQIHYWQLGSDDDFSFADSGQLAGAIGRVQKQLACYGQPAHVGFAWPAGQDIPKDMPSRTFVSLPPLSTSTTPGEGSGDKICRRFLNIIPLPSNQFGVLDRARDLSLRMITAKVEQVDGVFVPELCSSEHGLLNDDGTAGELLLPWRTTALALAGAQPLGSLRLAGGSTNYIFARDKQFVMALWRDQPGAESITLGDHLEQIDLWGRVSQPALDAQDHAQINVDRLPIFLTNIDEPLVRWQLSASLEHSRWPNELGVPINDAISLTNPYSDSVSGVLRLSSSQLSTSQRWRFVPREIPFKLAAGETKQFPFEVTLPLDASSGQQKLQLDFDLAADRHRQFTIYRPIEIGDDEVHIELSTHVSEQGDLVVEQKLVNKTDRAVSFKCSLFAVDRRRMATQVLDQSRGSDVQTYRLPNGRALVGQTLWLRAEEIDGPRTLNYRFIAQP